MSGGRTGERRAIARVEGRAIPLRGNDIDTDRIMPARYLRCVTFEGLETHVFEDDRMQLGSGHPFDRDEFRGASILVVNRNFGCGSSREHAPQGLARRGIRGLVGESFAEIFFGNCVALGIPCLRLDPKSVSALQDLVEAAPATEVVLDVEGGRVLAGAGRVFPAEVPAGVRRAFLDGIWDVTGLLLDGARDVERVAEALPYVRGF